MLFLKGSGQTLLNWIESQFGLNGPSTSWMDRVVAYYQALRGAGDTVFTQSFQADPWATASHLLQRRDALLLAGWNPNKRTGVSVVDELAPLEKGRFPFGVPDRIQACRDTLADGLRLPDHVISLGEDPREWPPLWQGLLQELTVEPAPETEPQGKGALRGIQENLIKDEEQDVSLDESLSAVQVGSQHAAVGLVVRLLREQKATVYTPDSALASMLDAALHADGQPTLGAVRESQAQPALQLLPLIIELLWEPVNPYVLLDLLLLPVGPLRQYAYHLARALEEQPGYGSDTWNEAIKTILDTDEDGRHAKRLAKWLEHARVAIGESVPTSLVEARCGLVAQWTAGYAKYLDEKGDPDEALLAALQSAASQASALGKLAAQLGSQITEAQLKRLLDDVRNESSIDIPHEKQAGGSDVVSSLADVEETDLLIWLAPRAVQNPNHGFTPNEVRALADQGIFLEVGNERAAEIQGLARAKRLFAIEVPSQEPKHPLWLQIHGSLIISEERGGDLPRLETRLTELSTGRSVQPVQFPCMRIEWDKSSPVPMPKHTSASALEDQLACPLKWTLRHALNLRYGAISSIPDDFRLKGLFAHNLMERVFPPGEAPAPEEAEQRMLNAFDEFLPRNAAPLAISRKIQDRNQLRRELAASARQFAMILTQGGYRIKGMEVPVECERGGVPLIGRIDCVISNRSGEAVVDFKLAGSKFEKFIEEGRALQIATYAHSRGARAGGYFILSNGNLFTPRAGPILGAARMTDGPALTTTWARLEQALRDASAWMDDGLVIARPLQEPAAWHPGADVALNAEAEEYEVCRYCDYDILCGRRPLS